MRNSKMLLALLGTVGVFAFRAMASQRSRK